MMGAVAPVAPAVQTSPAKVARVSAHVPRAQARPADCSTTKRARRWAQRPGPPGARRKRSQPAASLSPEPRAATTGKSPRAQNVVSGAYVCRSALLAPEHCLARWSSRSCRDAWYGGRGFCFSLEQAFGCAGLTPAPGMASPSAVKSEWCHLACAVEMVQFRYSRDGTASLGRGIKLCVGMGMAGGSASIAWGDLL
jgi:hypothetical protein